MSEEQNILMGSEDSNQVVSELVLKSLLPCGGEKEIVCNPGEVTVLPNMSDMDDLRAALFECGHLESMLLQLGAKPLNGEDVYRVSEPFSFQHSTALEELSSYGVPAETAFNLLSRIGSETDSAKPIEELSTLQKWRLKILCALKSSSKVNHFDFVSFNLPEQVLELVCEEIRKGSLDESKVVIVTGLEDIPKCWRNASNVRIQGTGRAGELLLGSRSHFAKKNAEAQAALVEDNSAPAPAKILNETQLASEAIPNFNLADKPSRAESKIQVAQRRNSTGNLTKVTGVRSWVRKLYAVKSLFAGFSR